MIRDISLTTSNIFFANQAEASCVNFRYMREKLTTQQANQKHQRWADRERGTPAGSANEVCWNSFEHKQWVLWLSMSSLGVGEHKFNWKCRKYFIGYETKCDLHILFDIVMSVTCFALRNMWTLTTCRFICILHQNRKIIERNNFSTYMSGIDFLNKWDWVHDDLPCVLKNFIWRKTHFHCTPAQ